MTGWWLSMLVLLAAAPAPSATSEGFVIHTTGGKPLTGEVREIGDDRSLSLAGTPLVKVPADELVGLRRKDVALPARPNGPRLVLANGDVLPGEIVEVTRDRATLLARTGTAMRGTRLGFPIAAVQSLWLGPVTDSGEARRLLRQATEELRGQDVVFLRDGERLRGTFTGLTERSLEIEVDQKAQRVERSRVLLVVLNAELATSTAPKGPYAHVIFASGGRLSLTGYAVRGGELIGRTLEGDAVALPWSDVVALDVWNGPALHLSDLKPRSYRYVPFLPGLTYDWKADRSLDGTDLMVGGQAFDKGLAMHDHSQLTWDLTGARRFEATVGLDERSAANACVRVRVIVDGKASEPAWEKELTSTEGPQTVRVDLSGAKSLMLEVDYATRRLEAGKVPFAGGRVNWADARLIKGR
jgi:hypothetical protein